MIALDRKLFFRDFDLLANIGLDADGRMQRVAFSDSEQAARGFVEGRMRDYGLAVRRDPAGNSIGTLLGIESALRPIAIGSHTDSVPSGGRFDGALGVIGALGCAAALSTGGARLRHPLAVIDFAGEEATLSVGLLGSSAMAGSFDPAIVEREAWDGRAVGEHLRAGGLDPARIADAAIAPGSFAAYLELHIEQGAILEAHGFPLGVVDGIVGIRRYEITFIGYANHAGTTPMDSRRDALLLATPYVEAVRRIALAHRIVGTVGRIHLEPGAPNVIPGLAVLDAEIRGLDDAALDAAEGELEELANRCEASFARLARVDAVRSAAGPLSVLEATCAAAGVPYQRLSSGAGHDAMHMAALAPQAMLFVPSRGGISHSPDEFTEADSCALGAEVFLQALLRLDATLD